MENPLDPRTGTPPNRIIKVIAYALWNEVYGPCPTDTAHNIDMWRRAAINAYQNDSQFYAKVNNISANCLDAIKALYAK